MSLSTGNGFNEDASQRLLRKNYIKLAQALFAVRSFSFETFLLANLFCSSSEFAV
jgi:hypothetical protein